METENGGRRRKRNGVRREWETDRKWLQGNKKKLQKRKTKLKASSKQKEKKKNFMLLSHGMANLSMCANQYKQYSINVVYDTTSMHTHTMYVWYVYVCLCRFRQMHYTDGRHKTYIWHIFPSVQSLCTHVGTATCRLCLSSCTEELRKCV